VVSVHEKCSHRLHEQTLTKITVTETVAVLAKLKPFKESRAADPYRTSKVLSIRPLGNLLSCNLVLSSEVKSWPTRLVTGLSPQQPGQSRASQNEICGRQSGSGEDVSPSVSAAPCHYHSANAVLSFSHLIVDAMSPEQLILSLHNAHKVR
jgi:hypothetical protein